MDGKRGWGWAILLSPVVAWMWFIGLFERKPKPPPEPPPTPSRWTESTFQEALAEDDRETWR